MHLAHGRPALLSRPVNAGTTDVHPRTSLGSKRSREDDAEDPTATRSSAKKIRLDVTASSKPQIDSLKLKIGNTGPQDPLEVPAGATADVDDAARSEKKSKADRERARAAAAEEFQVKYRKAFPEFRFYFDGVPLAAIQSATKKIKSLGGRVEQRFTYEATHFITPHRVDKNKENESPTKASNPAASLLGGVRSPFAGSKSSNSALEKAREWKLKVWDIAKLDSVLERIIGHAPKDTSLESLLTRERAATSVSTAGPLVAPSKPPTFHAPKPPKSLNPFAMGSALIGRRATQMPTVLSSRKPSNPSAVLANLLATERATNTTMERDPNSRRPDYSYFAKLSAFIIIEAVMGDHQIVGRVEYKPTKQTSFPSLGMRHPPPPGPPEYPVLHMDPRMRSPFAVYNPKSAKKDKLFEEREEQAKLESQYHLRQIRAFLRAEGPGSKHPPSMKDIHAVNVAGFGQPQDREHGEASGAPREELRDHASGFMRSTAANDHMNSGSVTSFSLAGSAFQGPPNTTSRVTGDFSFSQSGGAGNRWSMHVGAGGILPSFGGVRHATQVIMNRGAFADGTAGPTSSAVGGEMRVRTTSLTRTASLAGMDARPVAPPPEVLAAAGLRRTKSLAVINPAKEANAERKSEGYCECCKEKYDSLSEHIASKQHRRFATDPRRYKSIDELLKRITRKTIVEVEQEEAKKAASRAAARERFALYHNARFAAADALAARGLPVGPGLRSPSKYTAFRAPRQSASSSSSFELPQLSINDLSTYLPSDGYSEPPASAPASSLCPTTNTSACITPVDEFASAALAATTATMTTARIIHAPAAEGASDHSHAATEPYINSDLASALADYNAGNYSTPPDRALAPPRYRGTPMPPRHGFDHIVDAEGESLGTATVAPLPPQHYHPGFIQSQASEFEEEDHLQIIVD